MRVQQYCDFLNFEYAYNSNFCGYFSSPFVYENEDKKEENCHFDRIFTHPIIFSLFVFITYCLAPMGNAFVIVDNFVRVGNYVFDFMEY